jgi:hypothetical protein
LLIKPRINTVIIRWLIKTSPAPFLHKISKKLKLRYRLNFEEMSVPELRKYVLEHRDDMEAMRSLFHHFSLKWKTIPPLVTKKLHPQGDGVFRHGAWQRTTNAQCPMPQVGGQLSLSTHSWVGVSRRLPIKVIARRCAFCNYSEIWNHHSG